MVNAVLTVIVALIVAFNINLSWLLLIIPGLYIAYALFITYSKAPALKSSLNLSTQEKAAWNKYHAYLRFPFAAPSMSKGLSLIAFTLIVLGITLLIQNAILEGVALFLVAGFLLFSTMISRLNPQNGVVANAQKGNPIAIEELSALQSLKDKLSS